MTPDHNVPDASRGDALRRIVGRLVGTEEEKQLTVLELLRGMDGCLVTTDDARRARGNLLLAEAVAGYINTTADNGTTTSTNRPLPAAAASLLAQYFTSKLDDFAVIRAALMGCTALLRATAAADSTPGDSPSSSSVLVPAVSHSAATEMADKFFNAVHVPSLVQADRQRSYELLAALVSHPESTQLATEGENDSALGPPLGYMTPAEQLESIVAACDGEKDPRNVLLVCELWALLPRAFCGAARGPDESEPAADATAPAALVTTPAYSAEHRAAFAAAAEELYDVVAAYFPVSFRPPPGVGGEVPPHYYKLIPLFEGGEPASNIKI